MKRNKLQLAQTFSTDGFEQSMCMGLVCVCVYMFISPEAVELHTDYPSNELACGEWPVPF